MTGSRKPRTPTGRKKFWKTYRENKDPDSLFGNSRAWTKAHRAADAADRRLRNPSPQQRTRPRKKKK